MAKREIDVVAAGHICVDITPTFGEVAGARVEEIMRPGKLLVVGAPAISTGGPVSNVGLALRRLGLRASLMGKCGDDPFGEMLLELVKREAPGAEAGMRLSPGEQTSYTIVVALPGIDRIFLHCPGANNTFGPEDVDRDILRSARLFHFGYPPLMERMFSSGGEALAQIMQSAAQAGAATSLDLALPDPASPAGRADWRQILKASLPHTDVFLPSLEETMFMLRRERFEELSGRPGGVLDGATAGDLRALAEEAIEMGASIVVIKCGHLGAYLKTGKSLGRAADLLGLGDEWRSVELFEPACRVRKIFSATGSGDSAIAGFLCALLRGEPPRRCMQVLTAVGAQNLSAFDAVSGIRSWDETLSDLRAGPEKVALSPALSELAG